MVSLGGDGNGENSNEAKGNADIANLWTGLEISTVVQVWLIPKMVLDKLTRIPIRKIPQGKRRIKWGHKQGRERKRKRVKQ